jgi:hypothetical protein
MYTTIVTFFFVPKDQAIAGILYLSRYQKCIARLQQVRRIEKETMERSSTSKRKEKTSGAS